MLPRIPSLTLFSGPYCSLCDIAKEALAEVRVTTPFELSVINIHDEHQKKWKRKYVYDIPVLHIENRLVAKGRWGKPEIEEALRAWSLKESKGESN